MPCLKSEECYLCHKPGRTLKLFNGCQHKSACLECLRDKYIHQAQTVHSYPLRCFHPECQRLVQDAQIKRLAQSKNEIQNFRHINSIIKINKANFGEDWKDLLDLAIAMEGLNVCHCPSCNIVIIKDGGCDHMTCFCGTTFNWKEICLRPENQHPFPILVKNLLPTAKSITPSSNDEMDEDGVAFFNEEEENTDTLSSSTRYFEDYDYRTESRRTNLEAPSSTMIWKDTDDDSEWEQDCLISKVQSSTDDSWDATSSDAGASQSSWEEISEVSSVQSFNSTSGLSFLEVAQSCNRPFCHIQNKALPTITESILPTSIKSKRKTQQREEDAEYNEMFDVQFLYEGAKGARAGKVKFRFNHENNRKYWRYDQRRRSHARDYEHKWNCGHTQSPKYVGTLI